MGWLSKWRAKRAVVALAKQAGTDPGTLVSIINSSTRMGGRRRTNTKAMLEAWQTSPWFRAVIERVSLAAAVVPWRLHAVKPARGSRAERAGRSFIKHTAFQTGETAEVRDKVSKQLEADNRLQEIEDHPMFDLLNTPNPVMTGIDLRLITFASMQVVGEVGWAIVRGERLNEPQEIWVVPSHWITRRPTDDNDFYEVQIGSRKTIFSRDEFILFRNPNIANPYDRGSGLGSALADELETDEYIAKFQNTWFINRGKPDLIVIAKPNKEGVMVSEAELERAKADFQNNYSTFQKGGRSFWHRGDLEFKELGHKFIDLDLTEQRTWIKNLVSQVISVPPEIMGNLENSNRATITESLAILAIISTVPQVERMRAQLQMHFVPMFDERLVLGYWSPVPEDREFKLKAMMAAPHTVEVGEWRGMQGLVDRGEADRVHWVPMGLTPIPAPVLPKPERALTAPTVIRGLPPRSAKALPAHTKLPAEQIEAVLAALTPIELERELVPEIEETIEEWGNAALVDLGLDPNFDMQNPLVLEYMEEFAASKVVGINETTVNLIREQLRQGTAGGESVRELAKRVQTTMTGMSKMRSVRIARTETTPAAGFATWSAHSVSGLVPKRAWVSTQDDLTREEPGVADHVDMDGQEQKIDEPFIGASGGEAMYPGGFGIAEEDINCRCGQRGITEDDDGKAFNKAVFVRAFLKQHDSDEKRTARAARRAFRAQTEAMLDVLEGFE